MRVSWKVRLEFKPQDLWVGAYWDNRTLGVWYGGTELGTFHLWICLVPMLPIHITRRKWIPISPIP